MHKRRVPDCIAQRHFTLTFGAGNVHLVIVRMRSVLDERRRVELSKAIVVETAIALERRSRR